MRVDFSSEQNRNTEADAATGWKGKPQIEDWRVEEGGYVVCSWEWIVSKGIVINGVEAWKNWQKEPNKTSTEQTISSGVSGGQISCSFSSGQFVLKSENESVDDTEGRTEQEESHSVAIVRDWVSPDDNFIEGIEEDSEEAKDEDLEGANSACNSLVGNQHGQWADDSFSHTHFRLVRVAKSPVIGVNSDFVEGALGKWLCFVIISESNAHPETSDDEVILDGEDENHEWKQGWGVSRSTNVGAHEGEA